MLNPNIVNPDRDAPCRAEPPPQPEASDAPGDDLPPQQKVFPPRHPLSDAQPPLRPGVTNATLRANGVTETTPGEGTTWGLKIPYSTYEGGETGRNPISDGKGGIYSRERLANPGSGPKYKQPFGTPPRAYFPVNVASLLAKIRSVIVTEGEFKALSLVESGYPAIGLGGFYNFIDDGRLLAELSGLLDWMAWEGGGCDAIHFLGDADTALNSQFADAVIKFRDALRTAGIQARLLLPRMPVEDMKTRKGIDDARADMPPEEFGPYMEGLLTGAIEVTEDITAEDLLLLLLDHHQAGLVPLLTAATSAEKPGYRRKLARLANASGCAGADQIAELAVATGLVSKLSYFKKEMRAQAKKTAAEMDANRPRLTPEIHYCPSGSKNYLYVGETGVVQVDRTGAANYLVQCGYSKKAASPGDLSEAEAVLTKAEQSQIDWHGAIAGRRAGLYKENGLRLLVTRSPGLLTPEERDWSTWSNFLDTRLNYDPASDPNPAKQAAYAKVQAPYLLGYLARAARSLYLEDGAVQPRQALIFCGAAGTGKNVIQDRITDLLGGRAADPYDHMEGSTGFNGDLLGCEHWVIADKQSSARYADRQKIKSCIKETCVNGTMRINAKHQQPINVSLWRLLSISLNDNSECLRVLPSLSDDLADKLIILHVVGRAFHGPGTAFPDYTAWLKQVRTELPGFLHYLLYDHVIEPALRDDRYGIVSYHDPEIVAKLRQESPEGRLVEIIDAYIFASRTTFWHGTARALWEAIGPGSGRDELKAIACDSPSKLGQYLRRRVDQEPERFSATGKLHGNMRYRLELPAFTAVVADTESDAA